MLQLRIHVLGCDAVSWVSDAHFKNFGLLDPWKMKASQSCNMPGTTYQMTQCHISKDSKLQQCWSENLSVINVYSDAINTADCI